MKWKGTWSGEIFKRSKATATKNGGHSWVGIMEERGVHACCEHEKGRKKPWYRRGLLLTEVGTLALLGASLVFPVFHPFFDAFTRYAKIIFLPILVGFFLGGVIDYYIPSTYISKHLACPKKRTIFYSVGLGFLMSACSHGILALSMELHKKGASGPAVVSFLLASPWANLPITILLFGFFGVKAILIIFGAIGVALITGLLLQQLDRKGWIEKNRNSVAMEEDFSIRKDVARRIREYRFTFPGFIQDLRGIGKGMIGLAEMVLMWILIGMVLAGLAAAFVPAHIFQHYFGPTIFGLLITMLAATVLEVCSEGTSPLAFEIYRQTGAFGNAFAFLMGGVVTDVTEIGLVWKNLGRRTALWMLAVSLPQVILLGWVFNKF